MKVTAVFQFNKSLKKIIMAVSKGTNMSINHQRSILATILFEPLTGKQSKEDQEYYQTIQLQSEHFAPHFRKIVEIINAIKKSGGSSDEITAIMFLKKNHYFNENVMLDLMSLSGYPSVRLFKSSLEIVRNNFLSEQLSIAQGVRR